jgi:MoaA/NifB/PqqE/SkfB family radical SAM enzyme
MSNTFCPLPWTQVSVKPSGMMTTCCVMRPVVKKPSESAKHKLEIQNKMDNGELNYSRLWWENSEDIFICGKDSMLDVLNADMLKEIRLSMLRGEQHPACATCWSREVYSKGKISVRVRTAQRMDHMDIEKAKAMTADDGTLTKIDIRNLELRFGNHCNLKCVMCHPGHSNFWYDDWRKLKEQGTFWTDDGSDIDSFMFGGKMYSLYDETPFLWYKTDLFKKDFMKIRKNLLEIYWAGGEPLLCKEHTDIAKILIDDGISRNITLRYDTNLTHLPESFIDLWKKFRWVSVQASVDDVGVRNDYIRYPSKWKKMEKNLKHIDEVHPTWAHGGTTMSAYNALTFLGFGKWAKKNMSQHFWENMHFKHVIAPFHLNPKTLPRHVKERVIEKIDYYLKNDAPPKDTLHYIKVDMFKTYMMTELDYSNEQFYKGFLQHTKNLDALRPLKFKKCFPELYGMIKEDYDKA